MRKIFLFLSILISGVYLSKAIVLDLSSWDKLSNSSWDGIASITNKLNLSSNDLNIDWKLISDSKICSWDTCLWECDTWNHWDSSTLTCVANPWSETTPAASCLDLYNQWEREDKAYFLTWASSKTFEVYCDMTNWGWTLVAKTWNAHDLWWWRATPTNASDLAKFANLNAETTNTWTLVDEFIGISTYIRYKLPYLDEYVKISDLSVNNSSDLRISQISNSLITSISWDKHNRLSVKFNWSDISLVYDYTLSYDPPTYGRRGSSYSHETWPAYIFLK